MYNKTNNNRKRNPNRERSLLLLNIVILCLITLIAVVTAAFCFLRMERATLALNDMNARLNGQNGQAKTLFTREELEAQREDARITGEETGAREIRTAIQSSLESGSSTLNMLRELFPEDIVVSNQGRYYFYPVSPELPENPFTSADYGLDENGLLTYLGDDPGVQLQQGIQVTAESGVIDWEAAASDHVDYVMVYAGGRNADGELEEDAMFSRNVVAAHKAGLTVGLYYTMNAGTSAEAQEDAEWLIDTLEPYAAAIDGYAAILIRAAEDGDRMANVSPETYTDNILVVSNTLKLAGYRPMIYGNLTAVITQTDVSALGDLPRWISSVGTNLYFPYSFKMWRYTSESAVEGIDGTVARSVMIE